MKPKILFLGSNCYLSFTILNLLCESNPSFFRAIYTPGQKYLPPPNSIKTRVTTKTSVNLGEIGLDYAIPYYDYPADDNFVESLVNKYSIDLLLSVCYPNLVPDKLLSQVTLGAYNLHPSLLPEYRGPNPVFWQLKNNIEQSGVSLHLITKKLDAGAICLQQKMNLELSDTHKTTEHKIAIIGVDLINKLFTTIEKEETIPAISQTTLGVASYQSYPHTQDYRLSLKWDANHVFRFTRGALPYTGSFPFYLNTNNEVLHLSAADSIGPLFNESQLNKIYCLDQDKSLIINFNNAAVYFNIGNYMIVSRK